MPEPYLGPYQTPMMELFLESVNTFYPLNVLQKSSIADAQ